MKNISVDNLKVAADREKSAPPAEINKASRTVEDNWPVDPRNPRNWPSGKKWAAVSVVSSIPRIYPFEASLRPYGMGRIQLQVSMYTVVAALVSSMMAPALPYIAERLHITNQTEVALTLSIFMLSYALSPLFNAPLSEMYGRIWVSTLSCTLGLFQLQ